MDADHLIRMARQIGQFFEAMPDRDEAQQAAAQHLRSFWDPRMRKALLAAAGTPAAEGLGGFMAEAITRHRGLLTPATGTVQTVRSAP